MDIQPNLTELTTFTDWCRVKDHLPVEAKRTVEALLWQLEGYIWAEFADEALWLEWKEWQSKRDPNPKERRNWDTQCNCELADRILSSCDFIGTQDWGGYSFQITDLRPLAVLTQLTGLDLRGNCKGEGNSQLYDLTPLTALTKLSTLNLCGNAIADLTPLADLSALVELELSSNQITDIKPLVALTELTILDLSNNPITDLSPLANLKDLTHLYLSHNNLTDSINFSPLFALTKLNYLDLSYNKITEHTLEIICEITGLLFLDISHNRITDSSVVGTLPYLVTLKL